MASKSLIFLGLLFAVILVISSDVVSARDEPKMAAETKDNVQVDGGHGHGHGHCHHPHCREEGGLETEKHDEEVEDGHDHEHGHGHGHGHGHCHHPHC